MRKILLGRTFAALLFIGILWFISSFLKPYWDRKAIEKAAAEQVASIKLYQELCYSEFLADSNGVSAIGKGIKTIKLDSTSNIAIKVREWFLSKSLNIDSLQKRYDDSMLVAEKNINDLVKSNTNATIVQPNDKDEQFISSVFIVAKDFIKQQLKSPSSAKFSNRYNWNKTVYDFYHIDSEVEAQNSFGSFIMHHWSIDLKLKPDSDWLDNGNWEVKNISVYER